MDPAELSAWIRLLETPGLGDRSVRRLLAAYGSPDAALSAGPQGWLRAAGPEAAEALTNANAEASAELCARTQAWLDEAPDSRHVLTLGDAAYPPALLQMADPPTLLYVQGRLDLLTKPSVAIVGSRHATPSGREHARGFAAYLSGQGLTVVSGMALGIDGAAHEGALTGPGSTIAVVGTGLDRVYPKRHHKLAHRIAESGAIVSEFALGSLPLPDHFPRRNRIIAGLSLGTLVVEAAVQSGSLITARLAAEMGREVLAVPGSIDAPQSRGCHRLIKDGAKLVETGEDIVQELRWPLVVGTAAAAEDDAPAAASTSKTDEVLKAMGYDPVGLDALSARTGWPVSRLSAHLMALELQGDVARLPGALYQRRGTA